MDDEELDKELKIEKEVYEEEEIEKLLRNSCQECGPQVEDFEVSMRGLDVQALFPSMTARRTGMIVRERLNKISLKVEGSNWKMGLIYIRMNRNLTLNLGGLWKILHIQEEGRRS